LCEPIAATFTVAFRAAIGIPLPSNLSSLLHSAVLFESLLSASRQASLVLAAFFPAVSLKPAAEVSLDFLSSYEERKSRGCFGELLVDKMLCALGQSLSFP
jgi:hypothetical protein